jgi:hypothetical protein
MNQPEPVARIRDVHTPGTRLAATLLVSLAVHMSVPAAAVPRAPLAATPTPSVEAINAASVSLTSPSGATGFGYSVSAVGDVNADGYADFLVSTSGFGPAVGFCAYVYAGGPSGPSPTPLWEKEDFGRWYKVAAAGDVNGDNYSDAIFYSADPIYFGDGVVEVRYGGPAGFGSAANFTVTGGPTFGMAAEAAGDVNGDGYDDILVGSRDDELAIVYLGSASGLGAGNIQVLYSPVGGYEHFGASVAGVGDVNGDGYGDVLVGAPDGGSTQSGGAYLYLGTSSGLPVDPDDGIGFDPGNSDDDYGVVVAPAGDMNGDGYADAIIGDPTLGDGFSTHPGFFIIISGSPSGLRGALAGAVGVADYDFLGGNAFTAGDVNGDGYADALVSAIGSLDFGGTSGYTRVYQGGGPSGSVLAVAQIPTVTTYGTLNARTAGDVNGDGFSDIIVGAPDASGAGLVRLYYGKADPPSTAPVVSLYGGQQSALAGWSVAMGDVNGDGYDDIVVGKPQMNGPGGTSCGAVDLYLGGPGGPSSTQTWTGYGLGPGWDAGISLAAGQDINGDGFGDLVVGAHVGDRVEIWFGRSDWNTAQASVPDQILIGQQSGSLFGAAVAFAGDVNGDGYADVLVGAPNYSAIGFTQNGDYCLYDGSPTGLVETTFRNHLAQDYLHMGSSVAGIGDVDADGYSDIAMGTPYLDLSGMPDAGVFDKWRGGPNGPVSSGVGFGENANDNYGYWIAGIGDYDGDGYGDFAVGAPGFGGTGKVYVWRGDPLGGLRNPAWDILGMESFGGFGNSVAPAGDVNGDGASDILIGQVFGDGAGIHDSGRAYINLGGSLIGTQITPPFEGGAIIDNLGHAMAGGGDVNGDGFPDFALGAPRVTSSFYQEGAVRVYLGNSRPIASQPSSPLVVGRAQPTHLSRYNAGALPVAIYGTHDPGDRVGYAHLAWSPGGRDRVRVQWRMRPAVTSSAPTLYGYEYNWYPTPPPTSPGGAVISLIGSVFGLQTSTPYGWQLRTLSRSPYFRFGAWVSPQLNARGQWDFRTGSHLLDVSPERALPTSLSLASAWPNPASHTVNFQIALPRSANVRFEVRDLGGRTVRTVVDGALVAGSHSFTWDGRDASGRRCAPGMYFMDLTSGGERRTGRVALVP